MPATILHPMLFSWKLPVSAVLARDYKDLPSGLLLEMFRARVIPAQAMDADFTAKIEIEGDPSPYYWNVDTGILRYS